MGWSDITTAQKYVGLAQNKLDNAFKQAVGLDDAESGGLDMDREELKPGKCPSCGMIVSNVWNSCPSCSTTLEEDGLLALLEQKEDPAKTAENELQSLRSRLEELEDEIA